MTNSEQRRRLPSGLRQQGEALRGPSRGNGWLLLASMVLLAPFGLGARGCDVAIVGDDCPKGSTDPKCNVNTDAGTSNMCGGLAGVACAKGEFCDYPVSAQCGAADQTGVCRPIPEACTFEYSPVCGCDNKTYGNACSVAFAGVSVQSKGECPLYSGAECGGPNQLSCGKGQFCQYSFDAQCGTLGKTGTCSAIPSACRAIRNPVCGCDGKIYGNECEASLAGVSVQAMEQCGEVVELCGGIKGGSCDKGEYCKYSIEAKCGQVSSGACTTAPGTCDTKYDPVCGCDGKTYDNECDASRYGISVAAKGQCAPAQEGTVCGGIKGGSCDKGQYCKYPVEAKCGAADQTGACTTIPSTCDPNKKHPVCGCDGKTYESECDAARASISIRFGDQCVSTQVSCGGAVGVSCGKGEFCKYPVEAKCGVAGASGICVMKPEGCNNIYSAVCGCDGKTYGNDCEADAAQVSVQSKGECPASETSCGGLKGITCSKGQYCDYPVDTKCGAGDQMGTCKDIPLACPPVYTPVCGCNEKTYPSACDAATVGVSVASQGECNSASVTVCGGLKGAACAKGEYCDYGSTCGAGDQTGTCTTIPQGCTKEYMPVCGCDGKTYANFCVAAVAGVSVATKGECPTTTGKSCGARLGNTCAANEYCLFPDKAVCGRADATGVCTVKPEVCSADYNPVCGCDGTTYSNACAAAIAGVSVDPENLCKSNTLGKKCGGFSGTPSTGCSKGEYCSFTLDAQCGAVDQPGVCAAIPTSCVDVSTAAVCGCDGKSYKGSCAAARAGTSVAYTGACK